MPQSWIPWVGALWNPAAEEFPPCDLRIATLLGQKIFKEQPLAPIFMACVHGTKESMQEIKY